jgi:proteasome-associated ATPase
MASPDQTTAIELIDRIIEHSPRDDARLRSYLSSLKSTVKNESKQHEDARRLIAEYEEAYAKLTAPANRVGVFLSWLDDRLALIALGDTEYIAQVDPALDTTVFRVGTRVKVNEAYAVIGTLEASPNGALVPVSEELSQNRLRLGSEIPGGGSRIVLKAADLESSKIEAGDEVRLDPSGRVAVEHFPKRESRDYFFEQVPEITWDQVGGQESAIQLIRDTIEQPLLHPEIYAKFDKKPIKGLLLFGPPGCGKTLIGKATAYNLTQEYAKRVGHDVKEYFMYISGPKILNMWLGETERMVRDIFKTAREKAKEGRLVFIFMDEAESVLRTRSSGRWLNISNTVVPQFCAELDGLVSLDNVVLMLTSNRPDYIDPAVLRPERIDRKVKISRPDEGATRQILGIYLHESIPLVDGASREEMMDRVTHYLWRKSRDSEFLKVFLKNGSSETLYRKDLLSGALIKSVVDRAKDHAIRRAIADPSIEPGIEIDDLISAVDAEYKENEIFPKSDTQEDWLKLLDYDPENVASVKPIGTHKGEELARKSVI